MNPLWVFSCSIYFLSLWKRAKEKDRATEFIEKREKITAHTIIDLMKDSTSRNLSILYIYICISTKRSSLHLSYIICTCRSFFPLRKRESVSLSSSPCMRVCMYLCLYGWCVSRPTYKRIFAVTYATCAQCCSFKAEAYLERE